MKLVLRILGIVAIPVLTGWSVLLCASDAPPRWNFDTWNHPEGWTVSEGMKGSVMGGSLWLTLTSSVSDPRELALTRFQIYGDRAFGHRQLGHDIHSPTGLAIPAAEVKKVRMQVLNLSPVTDAYVLWWTKEQSERPTGSVRFTMRPDSKQWQELVCHIDDRWSGIIDRIAIRLPIQRVRGDIWIDWIEVGDGPLRPPIQRPDISSRQVTPRVHLPGISQQDFEDAFRVLDECLIVDVPVFGFTYPVMGPGGKYGQNWWQVDSSLNLAGAKWANQEFAENVMRGFRDVQAQNPDGRIDLYGGSAVRGQVADASSIPRFFEVAYDVARRSGDSQLRREIYQTMKKYLDWWLSPVKRDARTGLITGIFEEALGEPDPRNIAPQTLAPVDLNVAVAVGCFNTSRLARRLAKNEEAAAYEQAFHELKDSINEYLWDEDTGAYYNFTVKENRHRHRLISSTFDPFRLGIAPPERVERLIGKLLDPSLFNWNKLPVTSIAMTEQDYVEAKGTYDGRAWLGDIWTMRNLVTIAGLEDVDRHALAAELSWTTIKAFSGNYSEYLVPGTGKGHGVERYGWSASQYIQAVIEHLFGVDYDHFDHRLRIAPRLPRKLMNKEIWLKNLVLPTDDKTRLGVTVRQTAPGRAQITVEISGPLPAGEIEVLLPKNQEKAARVTDGEGRELPLIEDPQDLTNMAGVRVPIRPSVTLHFQ